MEWHKEKDGERISTPVFVGMMDRGVAAKSAQLLSCDHGWEAFGPTSAVPDHPEVKMHTEGCPSCAGTRMRVTGPEDQIERMFSDGTRRSN